MPDESRLEEQALSEVAEITLLNQLDEAENLEVDVRTNWLKMAQGQADSVSVTGKGLVMQKDIRVQEMELHTDNVAINLLSAIFGQIELEQPIASTARLVLTEEDINRALNSDYIRSKFKNLELSVEGQIVTLKPQEVEFQLPGNGKMVIIASVLLEEMGNTRQISFNVVLRPRTAYQPLLMEGFNCTNEEAISIEFTIALMKKLKELVNLPYFDLEGIALHIKELDVQKGSLTVQTEAYVKQLPDL